MCYTFYHNITQFYINLKLMDIDTFTKITFKKITNNLFKGSTSIYVHLHIVFVCLRLIKMLEKFKNRINV